MIAYSDTHIPNDPKFTTRSVSYRDYVAFIIAPFGQQTFNDKVTYVTSTDGVCGKIISDNDSVLLRDCSMGQHRWADDHRTLQPPCRWKVVFPIFGEDIGSWGLTNVTLRSNVA